MNHDRLTPPRPAPDALDHECAALLAEPFASAWCAPVPSHTNEPAALRERLLGRIARSAKASQAFHTVRLKDAPTQALAPGVAAHLLYQSTHAEPRSGEPCRVRIVDMAPGASWQPAVDAAAHSEWLVMQGDIRWGNERRMRPYDFRRVPAGMAIATLRSAGGARLYVREAVCSPSANEAPHTVHDATAPWDAFAPGVQRRVLWTDGHQAALLYHAMPGAQVPQHGHGHDEECLMLEGDVFLDDLLLRPGDYQLAPAGTLHEGVSTDTGGVLFAHGDLALDIRTP